MTQQTSVLFQKIFEAKYDKGYRYLDRCGDAMVILEESLPKLTSGSIWMPDEMAPTGAKIKCPDLDITITFGSNRISIEQIPTDQGGPFQDITKHVLDTILSKFSINEIIRFGRRSVYILGADSREHANELSVKYFPSKNWLITEDDDWQSSSCEATTVLRSSDDSTGIRFLVKPVWNIEAPDAIDERLRTPPRMLKEGQRKQLLQQRKRRRKRESHPDAGLLLDLDYFWIKHESMEFESFITDAEKQLEKQLNVFLKG